MSVTISDERHRLCCNSNGVVITNDVGDLVLFDTVDNTTLSVVNDTRVMELLGHLPAVTLDEIIGTKITSGENIEPELCFNVAGGAETADTVETADDDIDCDLTDGEVWMKNSGKPTKCDRMATSKLISLVGSPRFKPLLKDKTTKKKNVWTEIGKEMVKAGFKFGSRDIGTVCAQKWRNEEGKTLKFLQNGGPNKTGSGKIVKPIFYEEVHGVIKDTSKAKPARLLDSLCTDNIHRTNLTSTASTSNLSTSSSSSILVPPSTSSSTSTSIQHDSPSSSHFESVLKTTRPEKSSNKVDNAAILDFLKQESKERKEQSEQLLKVLQDKIVKDSENKSKMLDLLAQLVLKK